MSHDAASAASSWLKQWQAAGPALKVVRRRELRELRDDEALAATEALVSLAGSSPLPEDRRRSSGLVAQQALLHRRRPR